MTPDLLKIDAACIDALKKTKEKLMVDIRRVVDEMKQAIDQVGKEDLPHA